MDELIIKINFSHAVWWAEIHQLNLCCNKYEKRWRRCTRLQELVTSFHSIFEAFPSSLFSPFEREREKEQQNEAEISVWHILLYSSMCNFQQMCDFQKSFYHSYVSTYVLNFDRALGFIITKEWRVSWWWQNILIRLALLSGQVTSFHSLPYCGNNITLNKPQMNTNKTDCANINGNKLHLAVVVYCNYNYFALPSAECWCKDAIFAQSILLNLICLSFSIFIYMLNELLCYFLIN